MCHTRGGVRRGWALTCGDTACHVRGACGLSTLMMNVRAYFRFVLRSGKESKSCTERVALATGAAPSRTPRSHLRKTAERAVLPQVKALGKNSALSGSTHSATGDQGCPKSIGGGDGAGVGSGEGGTGEGGVGSGSGDGPGTGWGSGVGTGGPGTGSSGGGTGGNGSGYGLVIAHSVGDRLPFAPSRTPPSRAHAALASSRVLGGRPRPAPQPHRCPPAKRAHPNGSTALGRSAAANAGRP